MRNILEELRKLRLMTTKETSRFIASAYCARALVIPRLLWKPLAPFTIHISRLWMRNMQVAINTSSDGAAETCPSDKATLTQMCARSSQARAIAEFSTFALSLIYSFALFSRAHSFIGLRSTTMFFAALWNSNKKAINERFFINTRLNWITPRCFFSDSRQIKDL